MPGIVGIISGRPPAECESLVGTMIACMKHEPFYVTGTHSTPEMGVYAGWSAHKDSFAADQVFFNEQKDIALIFSGECFADPQIRSKLRQKGHRLTRNNYWLVHLYEEEGDRFFEKLNGLFSGLLIDKRLGKIFLFNDRYGVERIYWHEADGEFYFASEAKALLRVLPDLREFDEEAVAQFLTFGCTLEERSLFRGINVLPGGSLWSFEAGHCHKRKYFSPREWESQPPLSPERFQAEFEETFRRILPRYFESESRIGISLTSGLDSRMIMACLPKIEKRPVCYTFSGQNKDTLDARLAAEVAEACGLEHRILRIGQDFFSDFASHVDRAVYVTDGYLGPLGAHEIWMNGQARSLAPVRLTGVFGGEILRGRSMFKPLRLSPGLLNPDLERSLNSLAQERVHYNQHPVTFAAFHEIPQKRFATPAASRSQLSFRTPYLDNEIVALAYQVPGSLRSSRLPGLSLVKDNNTMLSKIPTDKGEKGEIHGLDAASRRILSKAAFKLDYFNNEGLPHRLSRFDSLFRRLNSSLGILGLHKFLHYRSWFQRELAAYVNEILTDARTQQSRLWNPVFLEYIAREHTAGRKNYVLEIDAVLTLEAVERLLFGGFPRELTLSDVRDPIAVT
jgi:asparagine synthase (glutamine-hydrolysing)